jgi:hypothetical protein
MIGRVERFWCYLGFIHGIAPHFWLHAPDFVVLGGTVRAVAIDIMYVMGINVVLCYRFISNGPGGME